MTFAEAYRTVNQMFSEWGEQGVSLAGETEKAWIFKSHVIPNDILSGKSVIVEKESGRMRYFNIGNPEDREIAYSATVIDENRLKELLENNQ